MLLLTNDWQITVMLLIVFAAALAGMLSTLVLVGNVRGRARRTAVRGQVASPAEPGVG
jgi:hypothetical protein